MTDPQNPTPQHQPGGWPPQQPPGAQPAPPPYGAQQAPQPYSAQPAPPPYGAQPYGAPQQHPPQYGAPQAYGQPAYPPAPGGHYPQRPQKSGVALPLILGGGFVVLIVIGVVAYFMFSGSGGIGNSSDPREVAQAFVNGTGDEDMICSSDRNKFKNTKTTVTATAVPKVDAKSTLKSVDVPSGSNEGTFTVSVSVNVSGRNTTKNITYDLIKEDGDWKVCGLTKALTK
ncbi:hypothetical protein OIE68_20405 [Nocardia vinacea]|uniref:DUF4878 domain-containing protein n=1 Tax=Nocardia vinacea TaxID=96468 RepID=A0ABZ1Z094_9NOCA|nr:hypothetical protein OIE68_20405 [Nocardia vinacea]